MVSLIIKWPAFEALRGHVLLDDCEGFAFLFARTKNGPGTSLEVVDQLLIPREEIRCDNISLEWDLSDETRSQVFRRALALKGHLIEVHSHPFSRKTVGFSGIDLDGLSEFVPHVWWRLGGGPYGALVFGQKAFDALFWVNNPKEPTALDELLVDGEGKRRPTNTTVDHLRRNKEGSE